ncbi:MAG: serine/threonine-protein kinase, partial [Dokdonella sp.]
MMNPSEKSTDVRALFEAALEIDPPQRAEWLITHCEGAEARRTIEQLIAADNLEHATLVDDSFDTLLGEVGKIEIEGPPTGTRIGGFTLLEKLGEGGSSLVFLAHREQAGVIQRVALKLLRRNLYTPDEQRRFRDERQALSQLDHPGIARLIEGGLTDSGTPYIALELVEGESIVEYARKQALDISERLKLFVAVCRAVEAAHRALIVHRDLKPSNVMVTARGEVKLLDFGIAKLLDSEDSEPTQNRPMTPAYAAPEQFEGGKITTATDVYALGVMLTELITGRRHESGDSRTPSAQVDDASAAQAQAASARALRRRLRGDLDNIALKAMAAEPELRYASAGALADDVERHLDGEPVAAHPPSRWYRAQKFIGRHRGGVATTALLVLAVLASLAISITQAHSARQEALRANTVRDFVVGLFDTASAHLPRDQRPTPEALVEQAQRKLALPSSLDAGTQADLLRTLGQVSLSLSSFGRAESLFGQAQTLAQQHGDNDTAQEAQVLRADAMQRAGHNEEAMSLLSPLLAELDRKPSPSLLRAYSVIAAAEMELGKPDEAIAHRRMVEALAQKIYGSDSSEALAMGFETGGALTLLQKYPEAIAVLEPPLARWRSLHIAEDDRYVEAFSNLAIASNGVGDVAADEARFRELLALKKRIYTPPHDSIARTLQDLAAILMREERYPESESLLNESLTMQRQIYGEEHGEIASTYSTLGSLMSRQLRFA